MKPAVFAPVARAELRDARHWIMRDSPSAARKLMRSIDQLAGLIGEHPYAGTERRDLLRTPFRVRVVKGFPYLVVYDPTRRPPLIVRFIHGARDLPAALSEFAPSTEE